MQFIACGDQPFSVVEEPSFRSLIAHLEPRYTLEAVLNQRSVADCVTISRKIVGHFKHSNVATSSLQDLQKQHGMKEARLQQDVATRWNSTFYMLTSLFQQKRVLAAYAVDFDLPAFLNPNQWSLIENILTILEPCEQLTKNMSSATANAADVIPSIEALKRLLNKTVATDHGIKTTKTTLLQAVEQRFRHILTEPLFFLATILDPRHKDCYFDKATKREAIELLKAKVSCASADEDEEPQEKKAKTDDNNNNSLQTMYEEILQENSTREQSQNQGDQQVIDYL